MMENESDTPEQSGDWLSETKNWIQDNIRIVLSVIIVLAIGFGVYFYSKRGAEETPGQLAEETTENADLDQLLQEGESEQLSEEEKSRLSEEAKKIAQEEAQSQPSEEAPAEEVKAPEEPASVQAQTTPEPPKPETVITQSAGNYEVTAANGDSLTTLARSAARQYLDANNDASITKEHKIYIEDYLAKKMGYSHRLNVGEVKTFSENDIKGAIEAAKKLTPSQLEHLKVFSKNVSNL